MSIRVSLNSRQQQILKATIRHYIATAEPVGSGVLMREYNMSVSSATIRNAMGALEREGFLYQPHTSAGRIPSDSGYRLYVDHLMQPPDSASTVNQVFSERLNWGNWSVESVLKGAAQILATLSGYITLITLPMTQTTELRHLQLVQVDPQRVMLIVVTDSYETQSILMALPPIEDDRDDTLLEQELKVLSNFLNEQLRGHGLADLARLDWSELGREFDRYGSWFTAILQDLSQRFAQANTPTQLMISGVAEVLRQPEFSELSQLQNILYLLEGQQHQLMPLIFEQVDFETTGRKVNVLIGAENPLEPMRTCTLISSTYNRGARSVGSIGVLGPTRMDYEGTIALVEATADYLSEMIG
jgi:heat-inducible transcriptional repressor